MAEIPARLRPTKPSGAAVGVTSLGGALGIIAVFALEAGLHWSIPGPVGAAIGIVTTALVQRFPRIFLG